MQLNALTSCLEKIHHESCSTNHTGFQFNMSYLCQGKFKAQCKKEKDHTKLCNSFNLKCKEQLSKDGTKYNDGRCYFSAKLLDRNIHIVKLRKFISQYFNSKADVTGIK